MATGQHPFWRSGTCSVWVGYGEDGALTFHGEDSAYLGDPDHHYEYWVTVAPDQFPQLRKALGIGPAADPVDAVCDHVEQIMARGERSWLDDHGIDRGFHCH